MILSDQKLRLKDDHTFVEFQPPEDRSRPLEWRRSLNSLRFEAKNFTVDFTHWVNESDILTGKIKDADATAAFVPVVKNAVNSRISISSKIQFNNIRDDFYRIIEQGNGEYFLVSRDTKAHNLIFTLAERNPVTEDVGVFKSGSFAGYAGFYDDDGNLHVEVGANRDVLLDLVKSISNGDLEKIIFNISVSSFSFEVDDALREWDNKRDLLIHGISTPAALESLVIRKNNNVISQSFKIGSDDSNEDFVADSTHEMQKIGGTIVNKVVFDNSQMKSIKIALWSLVGVLLLILLK